MNLRASVRSARSPVWIALLFAAGACAGGRGAGPAGPSARPSSRADARKLAWAELGAEAARRARSACGYYSRHSFYAGHVGRFEPEREGPCVSPAGAALHARVADLSLVAAHHAAAGDARAEAAVRAELERVSSSIALPSYVRAVLAALDAGAPPRRVESGCDAAAAAVVRDIASLAVRARAEALAACPADAELPSPPSTSYLVPASRCGERSRAQVHTTAAHALLLASTLGATARADEELAWVHEWVSELERRGEVRVPEYAAGALRLRAEIEGVDRCARTAELLPISWEEDSERLRVPGTGFVLRVPRAASLGHGAVELGGALEVRASISAESARALLTWLAPRGAVRVEGAGPPRWVIREGSPAGAGGVSLLADLGDVRVVLTAAHFLPVAAGLWDRVAALMATVERASDAAPLATEDLGFVVEAPGLPFVSFEPGRVRFSARPLATDEAPASYTAGLSAWTVMPSERPAYCEPEEALALARAARSRILARSERSMAGAPGCEVAAIRRTPEGTRFEYAAFGFLVDACAEIRISSIERVGTSEVELLERARAWADGFALSRSLASR